MNNSQQIGNIQLFNSLMGGLITNTSSLLMGGNANFNLVSFKGGGLLELTVGKDGISSKIGNGGTNISYSTIKSSISEASSLHKNSQINNTKYDKQTKDALRSQWGFGDKTAKKQLEEIIKGDTILKLDADGSEVAQSINENGQKIIHINSSQNEGFIDLGLILQHEAHRDGIVSDAQSQFIETANAVAGHTQMALAMAIDKLYTKDMLNHISSDTNLQNDINAYMYATYTGNAGLFAGYVGANYDTSADYWRVHENDSITWDGQLNFYKDDETDKNDAEAGKLLDYRNLDEVIESAKKNGLETVMLGGIEVDVERLKEIQKYNDIIIENGKNDNSIAAKELLESGFLSYNTAQISATNIQEKYLKSLSNLSKYGLGTLFEAVPSMIDHYSTRYVLNENDEYLAYFNSSDTVTAWTDKNNKIDANNKKTVINGLTIEEQLLNGFHLDEKYFSYFDGDLKKIISNPANLLSDKSSVYHGAGCFKWCFNNGQELVFNMHNDGSYQLDLNYNTMGTFNYGNPDSAVKHYILDMESYWTWGNTPDDLYGSKTYGWEATPKMKRIHPDLYNVYEFIKTGWNIYDKQ